jgi:photosystem I subunit 10
LSTHAENRGVNRLLNSILLAASLERASDWSPSVAIVMSVCNLFAIAIGRFAIQRPGSAGSLTKGAPALWKNFGFPELLATLSFGHILGAGAILGLTSAGLL